MELLASHDQFVSNLAADDKQDNFGLVLLHIIQDTEVADTQFKFRQRIWSKPPDCFRRDRGLVEQSSRDRRLHDPLLAHGQRAQLRFCLLRYGDVECHLDTEQLERKPVP
jgi:hypothetical protein